MACQHTSEQPGKMFADVIRSLSDGQCIHALVVLVSADGERGWRAVRRATVRECFPPVASLSCRRSGSAVLMSRFSYSSIARVASSGNS